MVLALVGEDDVDLLGGAADVRTEHHVVGGLAVEVAQVGIRTHNLKQAVMRGGRGREIVP